MAGFEGSESKSSFLVLGSSSCEFRFFRAGVVRRLVAFVRGFLVIVDLRMLFVSEG